MKACLLDDGSLVLEAPESLAGRVASWVPAARRAPRDDEPLGALVSVSAEAPPFAGVAHAQRLLSLHTVQASAPAPDVVLLTGATLTGDVRLGARRARLAVHAPHDARLADELDAALTIAAALLIGRAGGALLHAAGVVDPAGGAWLVPGDSFAGKSSTCAALVEAGWRFLADDQLVLRRDGGRVLAEGWPRIANLDAGWDDRVVTGRRVPVDIAGRWAERRCASAPVRGILLVGVRANEPTSARTASGAVALEALVRQSPWLMADAASAAGVLALLADAARGAVLSMSLGLDSYRRGEVIASVIGEALQGKL